MKAYGGSFDPYQRAIVKPVVGSVSMAVDGMAQVEGVDFIVDASKGIVTFEAGAIPAEGAAVTAGFAFDVPVRFDTDRLEVNLSTFEAGDVPNVPLVEIRV